MPRPAHPPVATRSAACLGRCAAALALTLGSAAWAGPVGLGLEPGINLLALGDFRVSSSDVEGRTLVGGNADIQGYSINTKNGSSALYNGVGLIVGGDLAFRNGSIFGGVQVGGAYTPQSSGNVIGAVSKTVSHDFAASRERFVGLSAEWDRLANTGSVNNVWGTQTFDAAQRALSVFDVDANLVDENLRILNLAADATVVINVHGRRVDFGNHGYEGFAKGQVVFNLVDATEVIFNGGMNASLLAPLASVQMGWGVINGQVVVNNWYSSVQVNDAPMPLPPLTPPGASLTTGGEVPEPATAGLAALALGLALALGWRRRRLA